MKTKERKPRLWGKRRLKMPRPVSAKKDRGFSLRQITEADSRYAVVKTMRQRLEQLKEDAGVDTVSKEWLAARAVFLVSYLESQEVNALEGKEINWQRYIQATKALSDVLNKLGIQKDLARGVQRLETYISGKGGRNGKH
jgi:hypothetical protein